MEFLLIFRSRVFRDCLLRVGGGRYDESATAQKQSYRVPENGWINLRSAIDKQTKRTSRVGRAHV